MRAIEDLAFRFSRGLVRGLTGGIPASTSHQEEV